jgi:hypothetical protein
MPDTGDLTHPSPGSKTLLRFSISSALARHETVTQRPNTPVRHLPGTGERPQPDRGDAGDSSRVAEAASWNGCPHPTSARSEVYRGAEAQSDPVAVSITPAARSDLLPGGCAHAPRFDAIPPDASPARGFTRRPARFSAFVTTPVSTERWSQNAAEVPCYGAASTDRIVDAAVTSV